MSQKVTGALPLLSSTHKAMLGELESYKLLVETVADYAIFMMDPQGYIQTWNKGAQKNKGYSADEIIGKHFSQFYLQEDKDSKKPERELELAKRYGRVEDEGWRVRKDGTKFWANVVITAMFDDDGKLVGFAKVTRNLTDRKQHEDNLRKTNAVLKRQQRELEKLNSAKDEFVSLASHQLRTPASAVKQLLGLLLEGFSGQLVPQQEKILRKAYEANERQIDIVSGLLRVAQLDAGKISLKSTPTDIHGLLSEIVEDHRDICARRKQTFVTDLAPISHLAIVDATYLRMAIENILDNASKYTPAGGTIELKLTHGPKQFTIHIRDTGVGVEPNDLSKLFVRFSRIPNELSDSVGGSGLGLYWAKRIIELHGGSVEVDSTPGRGTTFRLVLPNGDSDA